MSKKILIIFLSFTLFLTFFIHIPDLNTSLSVNSEITNIHSLSQDWNTPTIVFPNQIDSFTGVLLPDGTIRLVYKKSNTNGIHTVDYKKNIWGNFIQTNFSSFLKPKVSSLRPNGDIYFSNIYETGIYSLNGTKVYFLNNLTNSLSINSYYIGDYKTLGDELHIVTQYSTGAYDDIFYWNSSDGYNWVSNNKSLILNTDPYYSGGVKLFVDEDNHWAIFERNDNLHIINSTDGHTWGNNYIFDSGSQITPISFSSFTNQTKYLLYSERLLHPSGFFYSQLFLRTSNDPELLTWNDPIQLTNSTYSHSNALFLEKQDKTFILLYLENNYLYYMENSHDFVIQINQNPRFIGYNQLFFTDLQIKDELDTPISNVFVTLDVYYPNNTLYTTIVNQTYLNGLTSFLFNVSTNKPGLYSFFISANKLYYGSQYSERYFFSYAVRDDQYPFILTLDNYTYNQSNHTLILDGKIISFDQSDFSAYMYISLFNPDLIPYKTSYFFLLVNASTENKFKFFLPVTLETGLTTGQIMLRSDTAENYGIVIDFKEIEIEI